MAKRFTDTLKWEKEGFRKLSPKLKCAWFYLCDRCDHAGIWNVDLETLSFFVGEKVTLKELLGSFELIFFDNGKKAYLTRFVIFQYGFLKKEVTPHKAVLFQLEKYSKIADPLVIPPTSSETPSEQFSNPLLRVQDKDKDKDQDQDQDQEGNNATAKNSFKVLLEVWNKYRGRLSPAMRWTPTREKHGKARWDENPNIDFWENVAKTLASSSFCNGHNDRKWKADFDYFIGTKASLRVSEGKFQDKHENKKLSHEEMILRELQLKDPDAGAS